MDVGVKHMAKFHLLLPFNQIKMILYVISCPLSLIYTSTSMDSFYEVVVLLHIQTIICDKILPPGDYL